MGVECEVIAKFEKNPEEAHARPFPWAALALSLASYTPRCDRRNQLRKEDVPL